MPDGISLDFLHPGRIAVEAGPEGLVAVRLIKWARSQAPRLLIATVDAAMQRLAPRHVWGNASLSLRARR